MSKLPTPTILVEVRGGLVQQVSAVGSTQDVRVVVVDYDVIDHAGKDEPSVQEYAEQSRAGADVIPLEDGSALLQSLELAP